MKHYPNLFSPLKVGPLRLKNRIALAPMSFPELDAKQGYAQDIIAFYEDVAKGGAAVVTVGENIVSLQNGKSHPQMVLVNDPKVFPSLSKLVDAIHRHNAVASIEISHGGALCDPANNGGRNPIGPTAYVTPNGVQVEEMDEQMMGEVADDFANAVATWLHEMLDQSDCRPRIRKPVFTTGPDQTAKGYGSRRRPGGNAGGYNSVRARA